MGLSKKERRKEIMTRIFGSATATLVDAMSEEDVVQKCRAKVAAFISEEQAALFDKIT